MIQDDDNLPFGNNINNKGKSSAGIIFADKNCLNVDTDAHSLREIFISSQIHNTSILLLAETNTHSEKKGLRQLSEENRTALERRNHHNIRN